MSLTSGTGELIDAQEVARLLGVKPSWVYSATRRGELPTVRLGRYRRYRRETIESWVERNEQRGTGK